MNHPPIEEIDYSFLPVRGITRDDLLRHWENKCPSCWKDITDIKFDYSVMNEESLMLFIPCKCLMHLKPITEKNLRIKTNILKWNDNPTTDENLVNRAITGNILNILNYCEIRYTVNLKKRKRNINRRKYYVMSVKDGWCKIKSTYKDFRRK